MFHSMQGADALQGSAQLDGAVCHQHEHGAQLEQEQRRLCGPLQQHSNAVMQLRWYAAESVAALAASVGRFAGGGQERGESGSPDQQHSNAVLPLWYVSGAWQRWQIGGRILLVAGRCGGS
jgi:hypothetical protein